MDIPVFLDGSEFSDEVEEEGTTTSIASHVIDTSTNAVTTNFPANTTFVAVKTVQNISNPAPQNCGLLTFTSEDFNRAPLV